MAISINAGFLRTILGIMKIIECILILIVLLIARFGGNNKHMVGWSSENAKFLGIGSSVGYAIIVPSIILTYLLGANPSLLEFIINLVGGILFISMGSTLVALDGIRIILGVLAIILGIVFLIDFGYLCRTRKFSVTQTLRQLMNLKKNSFIRSFQ